MNLTCPKCDTVYDQSKKFCGKCGVLLVNNASTVATTDVFKPNSSSDAPNFGLSTAPIHKNSAIKGNNIIILLVIIIVIAVTGFIFGPQLFNKSKTNSNNQQIAVLSEQIPTLSSPSSKSASDLSQHIQSVSASTSTRDNSANIVYSPDRLYDNSEITCWAANLRDDPNPSIVFTFEKPMVITSISAIPGYKKFYKIDRYIQNHKPRQVTLSYDNQDRKDTIVFDLASDYSSLGWQTKTLPNGPVTARIITLQIIDTYPGQYQGNKAPANDVCISEFHFNGQRK